MARIIFLSLIFILIVTILFFIFKAFSVDKKNNKATNFENIQKNKHIADELLKLQNLKEEGIITEDEFQTLKKKLIEKK